jgi:hypothetical protein
MRRLTIAAFTAAAIALGACGGLATDDGARNVGNTGGGATAATEATAKPAPSAKIGDTIAVRASGVESEWTVGKAERRDADQYDQRPDNDGVWVNIYAAVKVVKGESHVWPASDLSVVTKTGRVYEPACCPSFKSRPSVDGATLTAGQSVDGWVSFGIPAKDLPGARVQLKQQALLADTVFGYWSLTLPK